MKQDISNIKSQIILLRNHQSHEPTEIRFAALKSKEENMKKQIATHVNLPKQVQNIQKNMGSGFEVTLKQLETTTTLIKEILH